MQAKPSRESMCTWSVGGWLAESEWGPLHKRDRVNRRAHYLLDFMHMAN